MRSPITPLILCLVFLGLGTTEIGADVIPGRWEKVEQLPNGTAIWVELFSGDRLQGSLSSLSSQTLRIRALGGSEQDLPRAAIRKIFETGGPFDDPLWDGIAVGAGVGAASYLIGHAALCCAPNEPHDAMGAAIFAAIGAGLGILSDMAKRTDQRIVYRARK